MAGKYDAVIDELNTKIDKLIKLYITSLEQNNSLKCEIEKLREQIQNVE